MDITLENTEYEETTEHDTTVKETLITLALPDSLEKIKLLGNVINSHPGDDYTISIHNKLYTISQQGMDIIQQITTIS